MKTSTKKHYTILILMMAILMLFSLGGCSRFEKDISKDDAIKIYEDLAKSFNFKEEGESLIKAMASFPINKIEITTKSTAKTNDVENVVETTNILTCTISGDENNLSLEIVENDGKEQKTSYFYIKDGKYYSAEEGKTDNPTEITKEEFEFGVAFTYYIYIFDLEDSNYLIGTSEFKKGFESAKKGLNSLTINSKILDKTAQVTLSKKLFKDEYKLQEYTRVTKETEENTTTTEVTTVKYFYK